MSPMSAFPVSLCLFLWFGTAICLNSSTVGTSTANRTDDLSTPGPTYSQLTEADTVQDSWLPSIDNAHPMHASILPPGSPRDPPGTSAASSRNTTTTTTTTTLMAERINETMAKPTTCLPGFQCVHGRCLTALSCECEEGWTGLFCHTPCPVCGPNAVCGMNPSGEAACLCLDKHARYHPENGCVSVSDGTTSQLPPITTTGDPLRPVAERECFPGFRCMHGYCEFGLVRCVCDRGWVGQLCHQPCTLDCRGRGRCALNESALQYCDCSEEFSGPNCESRKISESPKTDPTKEFNRTLPSDIKRTSSKSTSSTQSTQSKECAPGFPCVHGVCASAVIRCDCDDGWEGFFCHRPVLEHKTLPTNPDAISLSNVSSDSWTVQHIDWTPLKGYRDLSAFPQRNCSLGFTCRYGNCSEGRGIGCDCEPGFSGTFCQDPCPLHCGENGECRVDWQNKSDVFCQCNYPYTGLNCTQIIQTKNEEKGSNHWYAIGVAVAIFLVLMVGMVLLPYILWRRRNITVMKIVFWLRNYEDDDGRQYDAFVAYASSQSDRRFVLDELIPNLEERLSFSLCIHERDFLPGNYIAVNINEAIKKSRRTLIIVSPTFINRKWCQFEFEVAVREMVEHKHRILPIILGDISEVKDLLSDSLRHILSTVTYIEYPGVDAREQEIKKFWKKLELSMPKKQPKPASDSSATMSLSALSSPSMSSDSEVNSQTDEMSLSLPAPPPTSLSPVEKDESPKRQFRNFVRVPISRVVGDEHKRDRVKLFYKLWWRLKRRNFHANQSLFREQSTREMFHPQNSPESFRNEYDAGATSSNSVCFTAMSTRELQDSSPALLLEGTSKRSRSGSEMGDKYLFSDEDVLNPIENMPVCQIHQNFLGNQSLRYCHTNDSNLSNMF